MQGNKDEKMKKDDPAPFTSSRSEDVYERVSVKGAGNQATASLVFATAAPRPGSRHSLLQLRLLLLMLLL
jgi:hypothetical protein